MYKRKWLPILSKTPHLHNKFLSTFGRNGTMNIPFGGAHLILAGDMRQLKAVKAVAMFQKPPNTTNPKSAEFYARLQLGRTRYMEITDYIELTKTLRQQESMMLGNCLGRCRTNTETPADINLLNTRYEPDMQKALL
jgi:hypothetical protein